MKKSTLSTLTTCNTALALGSAQCTFFRKSALMPQKVHLHLKKYTQKRIKQDFTTACPVLIILLKNFSAKRFVSALKKTAFGYSAFIIETPARNKIILSFLEIF